MHSNQIEGPKLDIYTQIICFALSLKPFIIILWAYSESILSITVILKLIIEFARLIFSYQCVSIIAYF